ncbi:MAG: polyprenyl synthetase family protein [Bacteroidia bacterium]|nr:polyprenyl synthetase family protein [Bacteroidia bacterium]
MLNTFIFPNQSKNNHICLLKLFLVLTPNEVMEDLPGTKQQLESVKHLIADLRDRFEEYLIKQAFKGYPAILEGPTQHIMGLKGKRIRPILLLSTCEMFGGEIEDAMGPASAIEIFHNFSLVHDDIIDNADTRRGAEAVHKKYGLHNAILVGDGMLLHSFIQLSKSRTDNLKDLLRVFNKAASEVIEGEQYDVNFETQDKVSEEEYMLMIKNKTSVLLAASLQLGAIIGNASVEDQQHIYDFGLNLGLAFQIKDDYLDSYGDTSFGKRIGGDILQNKKTFLLITAMNNASRSDLEEIKRLSSEKDEAKKISDMLAIFDRLNVKGKTFSKMEQLYSTSMKSLNKLSIEEEKKSVLKTLAEMIYNRSR